LNLRFTISTTPAAAATTYFSDTTFLLLLTAKLDRNPAVAFSLPVCTGFSGVQGGFAEAELLSLHDAEASDDRSSAQRKLWARIKAKRRDMSEVYVVRMSAVQKQRWEEVLKAIMQHNPDPRIQELYNSLTGARKEKN
jgi:hypothetical protein